MEALAEDFSCPSPRLLEAQHGVRSAAVITQISPRKCRELGGSRSQTGCPLDRVLWFALPDTLLRRILILSLRKNAAWWEEIFCVFGGDVIEVRRPKCWWWV